MAGITFSEASGVADSIYGKSQAPIRQIIEKRGEILEAESALPKIFNMQQSDRWAEKLTTLTAMGSFEPVGENGAYPVTDMEEGFSKTIEHMSWRQSFSISREMIKDSSAVNLKRKPLALVSAAHRTREEFGARMLGAGLQGNTYFDVAVGKRKQRFDATAADGKALFAIDHPSKVKGVAQANMFDGAFSVDNLAKMETAMQMFRGDNGELLDVSPDTILIPNDALLKKAVFEAIGADKDPATANNGFNFQYGRWNVVVWSYLNQFLGSDTAPYILLDSKFNELYNGAVWFDRENLDIRSTLSDENDANVWLAYMRFGAGFNDWRFAAVGGISGAVAL